MQKQLLFFYAQRAERKEYMYNKDNWYKQNILPPERVTAKKAASMMLDFRFLPETESIP